MVNLFPLSKRGEKKEKSRKVDNPTEKKKIQILRLVKACIVPLWETNRL